MYLVWGLFLMSFFNKVPFQAIIIILFTLRLFKTKEMFIWWLVCTLFFLMSYKGLPLLGSNFVVERVSPYRVGLRQGINTVEVVGNHDFTLGERVRVNDSLNRDKPNEYQKMRHYKGQISSDGVTSLKTNTLRANFWSRISSYEYTLNYFLHDSNTLFSYLSLQLAGFLVIIELIYTFFVGDRGVKLLKVALTIMYGFFFGWVFAVIRILLKEVIKERWYQMLVLLLLFPSCASYPGFYLVYGPFLLKHLHYKFSDVNELYVRMFMLWNLLGRIHLLEVFLYPLIKVLAGLISLFAFMHFSFLSEFILSMLHSIQANRWLVVGAPPLIFMGLFLVFNHKQTIIALCLIAVSLNYFPIMRVSMLNVYQGDAILIQYPFSAYTILIDTGKAVAYSTLKKSLYKKGVKTIDTLIITHDDEDHSGSLGSIVKDFSVKSVVRDKGESVIGMVPLGSQTYDNANDDSLIYYMDIMNLSFLFMGDAGVDVELDLILDYPSLQVDVLKLGHHGSKTSTSDRFLKSIRPRLGLISSDPKFYNHPSKEVMALLHKHRIPSVQTSVEGDVSIYVLPYISFMVSQQGGFGIIRKRVI